MPFFEMRKLLLAIIFNLLVLLTIGQDRAQCTFTLSNSVVDSSCYTPHCSGIYILTATGGTPPYNWPTGKSYKTADTLTGVCSGIYTVTVTDTAGCTGTTIAKIKQYTKPRIDSFHIVKPSCPTCCDGSITPYSYCGYVPFNYSWSPGGGFNPTQTGVCYGTTYTCCLTDSHGNMVCDTVTVVGSPTSVQQYSDSKVIILSYPNPNYGKFMVALKNINEQAEFEVYNILSEKVFTSMLNKENTFIDISNNTKGIYLYHITTEKGEFIGSGKLVIQ
jgi:hypothetical protein